MNNYKNLKVWKEAIELLNSVYSVTARFPSTEKYNLVSQINRSGISIASNIAEGAGRNSPKEFINFLSMANGSSFELDTQLIIANRLGFSTEDQENIFSDLLDHIQKMIFKLQIS